MSETLKSQHVKWSTKAVLCVGLPLRWDWHRVVYTWQWDWGVFPAGTTDPNDPVWTAAIISTVAEMGATGRWYA